MNDPTNSIMGYVIAALVSIVALAVGVKTLLSKPPASNGNGNHDVTRREFEEHKILERETTEKLNALLHDLEIKMAILHFRQKAEKPEEPK